MRNYIVENRPQFKKWKPYKFFECQGRPCNAGPISISGCGKWCSCDDSTGRCKMDPSKFRTSRPQTGFVNQSGVRPNTHYRGSCCEWCADRLQGRAIGNTPPIGMLYGQKCSDFMCGNPNYCPGKYGVSPSRPAITPPSPVEELWFDS